jgi:hypothetical protein
MDDRTGHGHRVVRKLVPLGWKRRLGPVEIPTDSSCSSGKNGNLLPLAAESAQEAAGVMWTVAVAKPWADLTVFSRVSPLGGAEIVLSGRLGQVAVPRQLDPSAVGRRLGGGHCRVSSAASAASDPHLHSHQRIHRLQRGFAVAATGGQVVRVGGPSRPLPQLGPTARVIQSGRRLPSAQAGRAILLTPTAYAVYHGRLGCLG